MLLSGAALVLAAIVGFVWLSHARAMRRFNAAVEAYVEREMHARRDDINRRLRYLNGEKRSE